MYVRRGETGDAAPRHRSLLAAARGSSRTIGMTGWLRRARDMETGFYPDLDSFQHPE